MASFSAQRGGQLVDALVAAIKANKAYLSEIDGAIGDGDHGITMNKGFSLYEERYGADGTDLSTALDKLGQILLTEIGGSMGPIYGTFFIEMAKPCAGAGRIGTAIFYDMLAAALAGVQELGGAQLGDKTLLDTLIPAVGAFSRALGEEKGFAACLESMREAANTGWQSTRDLQARVGRASRLGECSVGTLDAGATSCWLLLDSLADGIAALLEPLGNL